MHSNNNVSLAQFYEQLITEFDEERGIMWCFMNPSPRPCFTPQLLDDLNRFLQTTREKVCCDIRSHASPQIKYIVFGSYKPGVFSLGGDLRLFTECIHNCDRERLNEYMRLSIQVMYKIYSNIDVPITTISLIRGSALGAGFEGALSCDYIISEKGAQLGFPEVLFNMFPGMGAYSFLARRIGPALVERMILDGRIYSTEELYDIGLVDVIADDGCGLKEVDGLIRKLGKSRNTRQAILKIRNKINPVSLDEMLEIGEIWVESAMALSSRELKVMQRLVRAQDRMASSLSQTVSEELQDRRVQA